MENLHKTKILIRDLIPSVIFADTITFNKYELTASFTDNTQWRGSCNLGRFPLKLLQEYALGKSDNELIELAGENGWNFDDNIKKQMDNVLNKCLVQMTCTVYHHLEEAELEFIVCLNMGDC